MLQSMGSQRTGHDLVTEQQHTHLSVHAHTHIHTHHFTDEKTELQRG